MRLTISAAFLFTATLALTVHATSVAQAEETLVYPAQCFSVAATQPFASLAQDWMQSQQVRGASNFVMSGNTVCAY